MAASASKIEMEGLENKVKSSTLTLSERIIEDARTVFKSSKERHKTLFYKIVVGGSSHTIAEVIATIKKSTEDEILYHWLMGNHNSDNATIKLRGSLCIKLCKYILLIPLWIILTPLFYWFHNFINSILNSTRINASVAISTYERIEFPLAFAAISGEETMIKLFLDYGIPIDMKDVKGNNVIHYLADLSALDFQKAKDCYYVVKNMTKTGHLTKEVFHRMVKYEENIHMQNPLEYAAQFGSLQFANMLLEDTLLKETLHVSNSNVSIAEDEESMNSSTASLKYTKTSKDSKEKRQTGWIERKLDITKYSAFSRHGFMSHILHLLSARPTTSISSENWRCIQQNANIQKWMKLKFIQWIPLVVLVSILEVGITLVLVLGMMQNTQGDMLLTPNKEIFLKSHIQLFLNNWNQTTDTSSKHYDLATTFFSKYPDIQAAIPAKGMDYIELLDLIQRIDGYNNYSTDNITSLYEYICVTGSEYYKVGDIVLMDNCTKLAADAILESCTEKGSKYTYYFINKEWDPYEFAIATSFLTPIFNNKVSALKNIINNVTLSTATVYGIIFFLAVYFGIYLTLDLFCRLATLIKQISSNITLYAIFATPLQGSYTKGQCKVFGGFGYLLLIFYYWGAISNYFGGLRKQTNDLKNELLSYDRTTEDNIRTNFMMGVIMIGVLVSRVILHLNMLKMFPWIGTFVITTFEMAADLFQFTIVYVLIVFFFAVIFHLVSRDATCPAYRNEHNEYLYNSLFSTFALGFGHIDVIFDNDPLKVAYVVYVVISIILLLNLIIAVMSSTASLVSVEPWASQLYQESLITDAIGIEHWAFTLIPSSKLIKASFNNAGFVVKDNAKDNFKISVDVFEREKEEAF